MFFLFQLAGWILKCYKRLQKSAYKMMNLIFVVKEILANYELFDESLNVTKDSQK